MKKTKRQLIGIILVLAFASLVVLGTHYYVNSTGVNDGITGLIFKYHFEFMLLIGLGGIAVGAIAYYLTSQELGVQKEITKKNTLVLLNLLDSDEKVVIEKLLAEKGKAKQYEIAYSAKLSKVRAHRAIKKLVSKNVLEVEKLGKVNSIKIKPEIMQGLIN
ncbi:MAG: hypothetical protein ABH803_03985 [Candidatus Micrarchaeota archaeon]